ncbi:hypothetical protein EVAR_21380_1 [Eumeta japonica]|uniref:Uncharacterized protein n=1 Tax=Eumeta variegata TaxID=151549 RepID=A0A4C1VJG2_EUMVA|nr:hypothetical protein EVAR_21380_1 [Eumeta japonica]
MTKAETRPRVTSSIGVDTENNQVITVYSDCVTLKFDLPLKAHIRCRRTPTSSPENNRRGVVRGGAVPRASVIDHAPPPSRQRFRQKPLVVYSGKVKVPLMRARFLPALDRA